jgi:hypothetical protein
MVKVVRFPGLVNKISGFSRFTGCSNLVNLENPEIMSSISSAGGASSRMGTDKSKLRLEQQTFTERITATLCRSLNP